MSADLKTLERLAAQMRLDARRGQSMSNAMVLSIADIIERAIGAPCMWPSRQAGVDEADRLFPGDPSARHCFNYGVKWAVEQYKGTEPHD